MKLQPLDIIVNVNQNNDIFSKIKRWAVGEYSHVFIYLGNFNFVNARLSKIVAPAQFISVLSTLPIIFESNSKGVVIRYLKSRMNQDIVVMRLKDGLNNEDVKQKVIEEAFNIVSSEQSKYDYSAILTWVVLRVLIEKLHLPVPKRWDVNDKQICSEAVKAAFLTTGIKIINDGIGIPLPGDFVNNTSVLEEVYRGKLLEEII